MTYIEDYEYLTDAERTYYEYHGKLDDGRDLADMYENLSIEGRRVA